MSFSSEQSVAVVQIAVAADGVHDCGTARSLGTPARLKARDGKAACTAYGVGVESQWGTSRQRGLRLSLTLGAQRGQRGPPQFRGKDLD